MDIADILHMEAVVALLLVEAHSLVEILLLLAPVPHQLPPVLSSSTVKMLCDSLVAIL